MCVCLEPNRSVLPHSVSHLWMVQGGSVGVCHPGAERGFSGAATFRKTLNALWSRITDACRLLTHHYWRLSFKGLIYLLSLISWGSVIQVHALSSVGDIFHWKKRNLFFPYRESWYFYMYLHALYSLIYFQLCVFVLILDISGNVNIYNLLPFLFFILCFC